MGNEILILMVMAVIVDLFYGKVDARDSMVLASMTFSFYFADEGEITEPFAGK